MWNGEKQNLIPASTEYTRGESQPKQCRDTPFAILFYAHIVTIACVCMLFKDYILSEVEAQAGNDATVAGGSSYFTDDDRAKGIVIMVLAPVVTGFLASLCGLAMIMTCAKTIIYLSLVFSIIISILIVLATVASGQLYASLVAGLMLVITVWYYCVAKDRIPFAAANLNTATSAVRANLFGLFASTIFFVSLGFAYFIAWYLGFNGMMVKWGCADNNACNLDGSRSAVVFFLVLGLFWTTQVVTNLGQVTTAGTVGSWWFNPEDSGCFGSGIKGAWSRAMTTSFGSICFGSLLVAIIQALKSMAESRADGEVNILQVIAQCILQCLQDILEYFNKWAMVYVGLYGYGYIEAGKNVISLFKSRGWTTIITEDLGSRALSFLAFILSLLVGCVGFIVLAVFGDCYKDIPGLAAYLFCSIISYIVVSVMFGVVDSSLNTVIVCYAEAPNEFQTNHPELSEEMRDAWLKLYPDIF